MPEGDSVFRAAAALHAALAGQELRGIELRWGTLAAPPWRGHTTTEVIPRGKHLLHRMDSGWTLHSHLRMEGAWQVRSRPSVTPSQLRRPEVRAVVGTSSSLCLGVRLGMIDVVRTSEEALVVGHLGPDVLSPDWDLAVAVAAMRNAGETSVAQALLDQRLICGVGTIFASESLFRHGVWPWQAATGIDETVWAALWSTIRSLMMTSISDEVEGRGLQRSVHGRAGHACRRCGQRIRVSPLGQPPHDRPFFSCPGCQHGPGPWDDGRPQRPMGRHRHR